MSSLENSIIKWKNYLNVAFILKLTKLGTGEDFRGFADLKENLGSVPRIHIMGLTTTRNSSSMGSDTLLASRTLPQCDTEAAGRPCTEAASVLDKFLHSLVIVTLRPSWLIYLPSLPQLLFLGVSACFQVCHQTAQATLFSKALNTAHS